MTPTPIPVLLFHGVDEVAPVRLRPWIMPPERFTEHLDSVLASGRNAITMSHLVDGLEGRVDLPERPVVLTFDDGLANFATQAWPALLERRLPATLYVVTGSVGQRAEWLAPFGGPVPEMLSWDALRTLDREGCEIGAHTHTHPELDTLPRGKVEDEITRSRRLLAEALGHPVRSFAYPHGYHARSVRAEVVSAGFDSAAAVGDGLSSDADDPFAITRLTVTTGMGTDAVQRALDGDHPRVGPYREPIRTKAWRRYRRAKRISHAVLR